jgi:hypothetical protein
VTPRSFLISLSIAVAAALACVPAASAKVVELGAGSTETATSKCPGDPCLALYKVTGYQGRSANLKNPFVIPSPGYITAFTIDLPQLSQEQIDFFQQNLGGSPQVQLSLLRVGKTRKTRLNHRLLRQSEVFGVSSYFGSSPTFVLKEPMRVGTGTILGLTVPTWLPSLASDTAAGNWWRSSRPKDKCGDDDSLSPPSAMEEIGEIVRFGCTYKKARLLFTATYVPDNVPTNVKEEADAPKQDADPK